MSNPNKLTKQTAMKATAGVVALAIAAGVGYERGTADSQGDAAAAATQAKRELVKKLADHPEPLERFKFIENQTPEKIFNIESDDAVFDNAARVQASIFAISSEVGLSGQEVFERLVSPEAQRAYENRGMHFLFIEDDPNNPSCYNPFALPMGNKGYTDMIGYLPLDASPNNPHPDPNPNSYDITTSYHNTGQIGGVTAVRERVITVPDTPDLHR